MWSSYYIGIGSNLNIIPTSDNKVLSINGSNIIVEGNMLVGPLGNVEMQNSSLIVRGK